MSFYEAQYTEDTVFLDSTGRECDKSEILFKDAETYFMSEENGYSILKKDYKTDDDGYAVLDANSNPIGITELIVEDGSCVSGANSYCTIDFADKYLYSRNRLDWASLDDEVKKKCLIIGTDYIDKLYKWHGRRKFYSQELAFPRVDLIDNDGFFVEGIPLNVQKAVCEAAFLNINTDTLFTSKDSDGEIKRQKVDSLEVEYFESSSSSVDYSSIYDVLNTLLYGLYKTENDQSTYNVGCVWSDDGIW
jgi:hypothetical protein